MEIEVGGTGSYTAGFKTDTYFDVVNADDWDGWKVNAVHQFPFTFKVYAEVALKESSNGSSGKPDSWFIDQLDGLITEP